MAAISNPGFRAAAKEPEAPQALSALHRFFQISLYLLLLTSALTVIGTGKLDPITILVLIAGLLGKGWRWYKGHPPEVSEHAAKHLTIAYLFFFPVDALFLSMSLAEGSQNKPLFATLLAVIHLLVFTLLVRLYSARTTRDHLFLALVAFGLVLVSAILTVESAFLGFLVVFLLLSMSTFMGLELRRSAEGAASPPLASGTPAAKRLHRALAISTGVLSLGAVLFAAVIFLLLPRITAGFLSSYNFQPTVLTGFSDGESSLGQIGTIKQNPAVVMRVKALSGPMSVEYWRGNAFTSFDGTRWFTPTHNLRVADRDDGRPTSWYTVWWEAQDLVPLDRERLQYLMNLRTRLKAYPSFIAYRVILEPLGTDKLFLATQGVAVRGTFTAGAEHVNQSRGGLLNVDIANSISNPAQNYSRLVYEARSVKRQFPAELLREAGTEISPEIRGWYLQLPQLDPRIPPLARRITANARTEYDKVIAIEQYLRTQYTYSLEMTGASLPGFLFERKAGHCEYFATAMAVLLRTLDIPTRYARGFLGGEYNDVGNDWIVRARDAHSWVEVYFPNIGWVTFDPTPPAPAGFRGFLHRLSLYWDAAELMWIDWVVNYNFQQQNALGRNLSRESTRWSRRIYDWSRGKYDSVVGQVGQFRRQLILFAWQAPRSTALILLALSCGMLYLWKRRVLLEWIAVRFGVRLGKAQEAQLVTLYYQQMLRVLAGRGVERAPGQTPRELVARVRASPACADLADAVAVVTALFEESRYGSAAPDLSRLADTIAGMRATARRA